MEGPVINVIPPAVDLTTEGGTLRIGVGDSNGRRSSTWVIECPSYARDIYIAPIWSKERFKVSLHESGDWRVAHSMKESKRLKLKKRVVHQYTMPPELSPGWRLSAAIEIPRSSLSEKPYPAEPDVQWWPEPAEGFALIFNIWTTASKEADERGMLIGMSCGCAGSFFLAGGGSGFVYVDERDISTTEGAIEDARARTYANQGADCTDTNQDYWAWGTSGNDQLMIPTFVDLGNVERIRAERTHRL